MSTVEPIRDLNKIKLIEQILFATSFRNGLIFDLGINSGLRISDILNLNVEDVKNKICICIIEQKTGKYKRIPVNSKLKAELKKYTKNKNLKEPLFQSRYKNRMERTYIYKMINKACKEAGLNINVGTHTMRKTFGYHYYKKYKDIAMLQKILNHSSPAITMKYIGIEDEKIEKSYLNFIL